MQQNPRVLPHSEESERAVLAAVLLAPQALSTVGGRLDPQDFYLERNQLLYRAMLGLQEAGDPIDLRTLQSRLETAGHFHKVGGMAYLAGLDLDLPDLGRVDHYVEIVKERALRRQLFRGCSRIMTDCLDGGDVDADEALGRAEKLVFGLGQARVRRGLRALTDAFDAAVAQLEERSTGTVGIATGFADFDAMTQGLAPGQLIVVAGRPGMGKTALALNIAQHVAFRELRAVALFSLEMSEEEVALRLLASESGLYFSDLRAARLDEAQWRRLYDTIRENCQAPLFIDDAGGATLRQVASEARRLKAEGRLELLIVDYLQLMSGGARFATRELEVAFLSRSLKELAKELRIPVIAVSQLSRNTEHRTDRRPRLADLRESGAIEQDADLVCFLYRGEMYDRDDPDKVGLAELIVEKQRNGSAGVVELVFQGEITTFRSLYRE